MGYTIEKPDMEKALKSLNHYEYALIYRYSSLYLGKTADADLNLDECMEARFFDEDSELHLIFDETPRAFLIHDDGTDGILLKKEVLASRHRSVGSCLLVKQYTEPDEDGQIRIVLTRLSGIQ